MRSEPAPTFHRLLTGKILPYLLLVGLLVLAQWAENGLSTRLGWAWGGLASGVFLFTLHPLQRRAERRSRGAASWFRNEVRLALADGRLSAHERVVLETLREELRLRLEEASLIEREELAGGETVAPPAPVPAAPVRSYL